MALRPEVVSLVRASLGVCSLKQALVELLSNALDAVAECATGSIFLEVDAARGFLRVSDSGMGITAADMASVGLRYCTSKVRDLRSYRSELKTLGYRGEALASLALSCTTLQITSRCDTALHGLPAAAS